MPSIDLSHSTDPSPVLRTMQIGQHVLFGALLLLGAIRGAQGDHSGWVVAGAIILALWYVAGIWIARRWPTLIGAGVWLGVLSLGWLVLIFLSVDFSWVVFAIFLLCLHLLPTRAAVPLIALLTAVVIVVQVTQARTNVVAQILGPIFGAAVAIGFGLAYTRLTSESQARQQLVNELMQVQDDLLHTSDELAGAQRQAGVLAERARLAREIHDTLAQGFSSVLLLSRAGLAQADDVTERQLFTQIETTARDNLEEARRVVHALAPAALDDAPLVAALTRLVDRLSEQTGIEGAVNVAGTPIPLRSVSEVALLRVAQSALANVRQHSAAHRVRVTLTYDTDAVVLDIVDDGAGFDSADEERAPSLTAGSGFGLRAMRERLVALGGTFDVESTPGDGTAVAARIPLRVATSEEHA